MPQKLAFMAYDSDEKIEIDPAKITEIWPDEDEATWIGYWSDNPENRSTKSVKTSETMESAVERIKTTAPSKPLVKLTSTEGWRFFVDSDEVTDARMEDDYVLLYSADLGGEYQLPYNLEKLDHLLGSDKSVILNMSFEPDDDEPVFEHWRLKKSTVNDYELNEDKSRLTITIRDDGPNFRYPVDIKELPKLQAFLDQGSNKPAGKPEFGEPNSP